MNTSLLDYYKLILNKVSFDPQLLAKEYRKAIQALQADEAKALDHWLQRSGLVTNLESSHRGITA